jgi:hypothetical protein
VGKIPLLSSFGAADVTFGAAFKTLHQESQKLDGFFFVLVDNDGLNLLLFLSRKRDLFVCHIFSPCLELLKRRQAALEEVDVTGRPPGLGVDLAPSVSAIVGGWIIGWKAPGENWLTRL